MADVATIGHVFTGQLPRAQSEEHCRHCGCSWDDRNAKQCRSFAKRHLDMAQSLHSFEGAQADSDVLAIAQALADAEQRGAESAKAEAQPAGTGWVSVEERLPEPTERVIVCNADLDKRWWHACELNFDGTAWTNIETDGTPINGDMPLNHVTHWREPEQLPPPPERDR